MAANPDVIMGSGRDLDGCHTVFLWLSGSSVLPWRYRKWSLPRSRLLPFNVVQKKRTADACVGTKSELQKQFPRGDRPLIICWLAVGIIVWY